MKKYLLLITVLVILISLSGCGKNEDKTSANEIKMKELELKERELKLKEEESARLNAEQNKPQENINAGSEKSLGNNIQEEKVDVNSLVDDLLPTMEETARNLAKEKHYASEFEEMEELGKYKILKQSTDNIEVKNIYTIIMRGSIMGVNKFETKVEVIGSLFKSDNKWLKTVKSSKILSDKKIKD